MTTKRAERVPLLKTGLQLGFFMVISTLLGGNFSPLSAAWRFSNSGTSNDLTAVHFVSANTGWAVGASGTILKTADAGDSWASQTSGVATNLQDVRFVTTSTGIIVGSGGLILRTTDAVVWTSRTSGTTNPLFGVSWSVSTGTVWAVGTVGTILVSTNSGSSWISGDQNSDAAGKSLRSVYFMNTSTGFVAGDSGALMRTTNGGGSWSDLTAVSGTSQNIKKIFFVDLSTGYFVGDSGVIFKSTNAGNTWTSQVSTDTNFSSVNFVSTTTGWAVGDTGIIMKSSDSGVSFQQETSTTSKNLADIFMFNANTGFAVGAAGTIIRNVVAVSTGVFTATEIRGSLTPLNNVFDPSLGQSTTIRYYFKSDGRVTLKVYTLQGRLIRTLIDDVRGAGVYSDASWDGKNDDGVTVASGIYLVHIEAPNFSNSQKVAVVK